MKKVLFIMRYYIDNTNDSLGRKFNNQITAMENMGYEVWYTAISGTRIFLCNHHQRITIGKYGENSTSIFTKINSYDKLYSSTLKHLINNNLKFDFVYARNMFYCINSMRLLKYLKDRKATIITEIPTYPAVDEIKSDENAVRRTLILFIERLSRKHSKYVDLYAVIGADCGGTYLNKNAVNIENGVAVENLPLKVNKTIANEIHIATLARMARWHGYDRLIKGLADYYKSGGNEKIYVHMVGDDGDGSLEQWKALVKELGIEKNFIFEGFKTGEELDFIIDSCDIAVASLGAHRKNLMVTCEMKIREYMSRGIPFIYSTHDESISKDSIYSYKLKADESDVDFNEVIDFVKTTKDHIGLSEDMRKYAKENMSWEKQFKKIMKTLGCENQ